MSKALSDQEFLKVIDATPLVSIDLVLRKASGEVLLGLRENRPARDYWFVPGGRIKKNETFREAFSRLVETECQIGFHFDKARFLGPHQHLYPDNFSGSEGIATHYVVLAYELQFTEGQKCKLDDQHRQQKWWGVQELLESPHVHANTKAYFDSAYSYQSLHDASVK